MPQYDRPNILFLLTDQQSAHMMGCAGTNWVETPAMDRLAAGGTRFERAYAANPVCSPSRFSIFTGRLPSAIGQRCNDMTKFGDPPAAMLGPGSGFGWLLRDAGYEAVYGGKHHFPRFTPEDIGFDYISVDERDLLTDAAIDYLGQPHEKPFFLTVSLINPHDICYQAIRESLQDEGERMIVAQGKEEIRTLDLALQRPEDCVDDEAFFSGPCPNLPANFEPQQDEPGAIGFLLDQRPFRRRARQQWGEREWRTHRWAYKRLTEFVDAQVGRILDALSEAGLEDNTVVIFSSDHGDMDASHRMEHKTAFYEEAARVPLIVRHPGRTPAGHVDSDSLVSIGLDLVPTVLDYAGAPVPDALRGRSFRALAEGQKQSDWRHYLEMESEIGRAVVGARFKYCRYDFGENAEQLHDLEKDPGETRNHAADPERAETLEDMRRACERLHSGLDAISVS